MVATIKVLVIIKVVANNGNDGRWGNNNNCDGE